MTEPAELDDAAVERLLAGDVAPAELPPEWAPVAGLLRAARDVAPGQLPDATLLAAFAAATQGRRAHRRIGLGLGMAAALVLTGSGVAAANGSLPNRVQAVVHDVAAVVGVHVPEGGGSQDGPGHGRSDEAPGRPVEPGPTDDPGRSDEAPGHQDDGTGGPADEQGRPDDPGRSEEAPGQTATTATIPTTAAAQGNGNGGGNGGTNANRGGNGVRPSDEDRDED